MSLQPGAPNLQTLKINSHDPRCHQTFLQLSNDMHRWKQHTHDASWWMERESGCLALFKQHGYELQSGIWYCLIACHRSGWKGLATASMLFAEGFARQQQPCWPPLAAHDLRRQMLESYCAQILPLLYALPIVKDNISAVKHMQSAVELLQRHATSLNSRVQHTLQQFYSWLAVHCQSVEKQAHAPAVLPAADSSVPLHLDPEPVARLPGRWCTHLLWTTVGAVIALSSVALYPRIYKPDVMLALNRVWPGNTFFVDWQRGLIKESAPLETAAKLEEVNQQLTLLEKRLLDAEQKRKPHVTISELKTAIYQMRETLRSQQTTVEYRLYQLQKQRQQHQPLSATERDAIISQLEALHKRLILLSHGDSI